MTRPKIVVTLPAYRAERTLGKTVAAIPEGAADHLILVDDASPDHTAEIARELGIDVVVHPANRGYGGNQKTCYAHALAAGADVVVLLHPDYQYDPAAVPLLTASILAGDADMTFGSRFAGLGDPMGGGMPLYRYLGNRLSTTVENLVLGSRFTEMHSGMRAYTRRCLLSLPFLSYSDNFAFDAQFLVDAVTLGLRVVEVPIPTRYTEESSSIGVGRSFRYVGSGLRYCVEQTARRGRRGRKSPVASRAIDEEPLVVASGIAPATEVAQWIVKSIGGYALRGQRLATGIEVVAIEAERAGWTTGLVSAGDTADAIVVATDTDALAPAALARVRGVIDDEGLVAFWTPSHEPRLSGYLRAHGFRVVGWDPAPRGSAVLVTARPA
ncbi:MAG TPA: glycosyltransferase family 2 protein [Acidimicrobiales bacterium]|nr:glycosyltransferase family 2 protein [Acidimicrobiales bacterium]